MRCKAYVTKRKRMNGILVFMFMNPTGRSFPSISTTNPGKKKNANRAEAISGEAKSFIFRVFLKYKLANSYRNYKRMYLTHSVFRRSTK